MLTCLTILPSVARSTPRRTASTVDKTAFCLVSTITLMLTFQAKVTGGAGSFWDGRRNKNLSNIALSMQCHTFCSVFFFVIKNYSNFCINFLIIWRIHWTPCVLVVTITHRACHNNGLSKIRLCPGDGLGDATAPDSKSSRLNAIRNI